MGRKVKDVLLFCNDVVQRQPHNLDKLIKLLNLDSEDLLTNENLQIITSLLKDHYDLLVRFGTIFLPDNYKLQPWKDMMDNRVYCMLIKGDAMYKLTSLEIEQQQFNAIEAAKRHEEEERRRKMKRKFTSSSSSSSSSARELTTDHHHSQTMLSSRIVTCETKHKTKNLPPATTTTTTTLQSMETNDSNHNDKDHENNNNNNTQKMDNDSDPHKPVSTVDDSNGLEHTLKQSAMPPFSVLHWGSRSRPTARKYSLAIPYLNALSSDQLHEFLKHKNMTPDTSSVDTNTLTEFNDNKVDIKDDDTSLTKEDMVQIIIKYCKLTTSSPYEVLPTFLKKK
jgi:hypothetical protein